MSNKRISESELILPSLFLMSNEANQCISTKKLIPLLTNLFKPTGQDADILEGRKDTYFSQKVRNLKSHDTFVKNGYAIYRNGIFHITSTGLAFVQDNMDSIKYLFGSDFSYEDIKESITDITKKQKIVPYSELIIEGSVNEIVSKKRNRSVRLRNAAIEHFTNNGIIKCDCCDFEFGAHYKGFYGQPCIEIHHLKPIFQYPNVSEQTTIEEALKNLLPVCPNCHRVIHKNHITSDMILDFKKQIIK